MTFEIISSLSLGAGKDSLYSAVIDTVNGFAYFGTYTSPGIIVKIFDSDMIPASAITNILGRSSFSRIGASVSGGIACGHGKRRR